MAAAMIQPDVDQNGTTDERPALPEQRRNIGGGYEELMLCLERAAALAHAIDSELSRHESLDCAPAGSLLSMLARELEEADAIGVERSSAWSRGDLDEEFLRKVVLAKWDDRMHAVELRRHQGLRAALRFLDRRPLEQPEPAA